MALQARKRNNVKDSSQREEYSPNRFLTIIPPPSPHPPLSLSLSLQILAPHYTFLMPPHPLTNELSFSSLLGPTLFLLV